MIPTNANIAPADNCIAEAVTEPVFSWRVTTDRKPVPKDASKTFGSHHRVCFSGIPTICTMFVGENESVRVCLCGDWCTLKNLHLLSPEMITLEAGVLSTFPALELLG